ncbi:DUF6234 family protein [Micromonospora sp. NPDC005806]|uniref:DUF6234 family protein n=1 Tax=Micromonospora sp. NPDC005806 TaxID=3364234 RepID=UPI003680ADCA
MTSSPTTTRWRSVIGFLVLLWVLGLLALVWWGFTLGMEGWADQHSNGGARAADLRRQGDVLLLVLVAAGAGGPAVIGLVAYRMRLVRTGLVFLVLAVAIGIPGLWVAAHAYRDLTPPPPPPGPPGHCVEFSGGDTRCPGG